jgi:hypothetical protein
LKQTNEVEVVSLAKFIIECFKASAPFINAIIGYSEMLQEEMEEINPSDFDAEKFNFFINKDIPPLQANVGLMTKSCRLGC